MPHLFPTRFAAFLRPTHGTLRLLAKALLIGLLAMLSCATVHCLQVNGETNRQSILDKEPLAMADMQSLAEPQASGYDTPNALVMYQPEQEDPLSFYSRTEDGEWQIPPQVDTADPWVRVLLLAPARPTVVDIAIEINHKPFRAAREEWIDKLLDEAKQTFLVRTGAAVAEAEGIDAEDTGSEDVESEEPGSEGTSEQPEASYEAEESTAEESTTEPEDAKDEDAEPEDEVPMVKVQRRQTSTLFKRLVNYLAADQSTAEREEVRWLLAEWTGGPATLTLGPSLSWQRANTAPLWHALDRNGDHVLSSAEIAQIDQSFKQADINRDDIVDLGELERLGKDHSPSQRTKGYPLLVVIDDNTDWRALRRHLRNAYPVQNDTSSEPSLLQRIASGDRSLRTKELANLMSVPSDLVCRVSFAEEDALVALLAVSDESGHAGWQLHSSTDEVVTVENQETYVELSAAQGEIDVENSSGDMQQTQVAIGAVVDGYPLLRLLDHDGNRQLTQRERGGAAKFLVDLDRNQDGQVGFAELPLGIRLVVTHGPKVHQQLARAVSAQRKQDDESSVEAPAWFIGMDRNKDGDLSRREFKGSPAQFAKYDGDGDGLISPLEAK